MSTLLTIAIMCLVGYISFIFIAETPNPMHRSKIPALRARHLRGRLVGALIALSSLVAFLIAGDFLAKLKASLLLAAIALLPLLALQLIKPISAWAMRKKATMRDDKDFNQHQSVGTDSFKAHTDDQTDNTAHLHQQACAMESTSNIPAAQIKEHELYGSVDVPNIASSSNEVHPLENVEIPNPVSDGYFPNHELVDQDNHADLIDVDLEHEFLATRTIPVDMSEAANSGIFVHGQLAEAEEIVVDDFFEPATSAVPYELAAEHDIQSEHELDPLDPNDDQNFDRPDIDQLESAITTVNRDAERIQRSVHRINELHEREQYYRTELNGARLAYEKAQEAQHETVIHDLQQGHLQLDVEKTRGAELELNLVNKRKELFEAESRVSELEAELRERQKVFHDQMQSLAKTKAMARDAALLARRAAVAQQSAHTAALKERAARERLEVSAKRAVDIARSAITKLAEEERKNSSTTAMH